MTTLHLERRNVLVLLVAGGLAMAAAIALADMAGYSRLVDAVQDFVPTWFAVCFAGEVVAYFGYVLALRDIARVDGGPVLSLRLSMRTVVAGFGVFAATHAAGGFSVDYWMFRRSGLRRREAVARVLALERSSTPSSSRRRSSARSCSCSGRAAATSSTR